MRRLSLLILLLIVAFPVSGGERGGGSAGISNASTTVKNAGLKYLDRSAVVDASTGKGDFLPVHRGHYDLSPITLKYLDDPAFVPLVKQIPVKSWRISVGRWEIGPVSLMAPEPDCYSSVTASLRNCSREFYRGSNDLASAQTVTNYRFAYLDSAIDAILKSGAQPYLTFDYMPLSLAANTNPHATENAYMNGNTYLSFSNGIRTSPPKNPAVYAEVIKQVVAHVMTRFAAALKLPLHVEIGNEPDFVNHDASSGRSVPSKYFWTGTRRQFLDMYKACAASLDARFGPDVRIGAASFAWLAHEPSPTFAEEFLAGLGAARLDFLSFHIYGDVPETRFAERLTSIKALRDKYKSSAELHCAEWGMDPTDGPGRKYDDMRAALHHATALACFLAYEVKLSHRFLIRDVSANSEEMGLLRKGPPVSNKPAAYVFHAYEMLSQTPNVLDITSINPPGKPMLLAGRSDTVITLIFFHKAPPAGRVGRMNITITNVPFADYTVDRYVLTDATVAAGDGLWLARSHTASGASFSETLTFTSDTLVVWRLTKK